MAIKEILDRIKNALGADAPAETKALIADAIREADDILDSNASANKESASRKAKIREMEAKIEKLEDDVQKASSPEAKAEYERLKKIEAKHLETQAAADAQLKAKWSEIAKVLNVDKTDKRFEKVSKIKDRFKLPASDTDELSIDDIKSNLERYDLLDTTGYFAPETKATGGNPPANLGAGEYKTSGEAYVAITKS